MSLRFYFALQELIYFFDNCIEAGSVSCHPALAGSLMRARNLLAQSAKGQLTNDELNELWNRTGVADEGGNHTGNIFEFARAIELAIKEPTDAEIDARFERWWHYEGSGMPPMPDEEACFHVKRVSQIAWHNGSYVASSLQGGQPSGEYCWELFDSEHQSVAAGTSQDYLTCLAEAEHYHAMYSQDSVHSYSIQRRITLLWKNQ